jgi:predicted P-loop ATPase
VRHACALREQGFRLLAILPGTKEPATDGFGADNVEFTCGPEWFGQPGMMLAILCGPCPAVAPDWLLCLDIDGDGNAERASFLAGLPPTLTSHDGRHLFFRVPAGTRGGKIFHCGPHDAIDLKSAGGYARETWDWAVGTDVGALARAIAPLPHAALAAFKSSAPPARAASIADDDRGDAFLRKHGFDPDHVFADAVAWLETKAPLPEAAGGGGAAMLIAAGAMLIGFGLDDDTASCLLSDVYCRRAWPDEEPDEEQVQHKIDEINRLGSERFATLELAVRMRNVREGMALTAPDPTPALVSLPAASEDITELHATWNARLKRNAKTGAVMNQICNVTLTLDLHPDWRNMFAFDQFSDRVICKRAFHHSWQAGDTFNPDTHVAGLQQWFSWCLDCDVAFDTMARMVQHTARQRSFHPVRDYLKSLVWDGVDRNLATYFGAEPTEYHRIVCAKWMRSAVARVMKPGCKADDVLILEGKQGVKKSSTLRALCPDPAWFYEVSSRRVGEKDFLSAMRGKWIGELAEIDKLIASREESELKDLLSRQVDTYRPAYARHDQDFQRQTVFVGTTNQDAYLRDETGNRRYRVVRCERDFDWAGVNRDRDQLWAQAYAECTAVPEGAIWWLTPAEEALATSEAAERLEADVWENAVAEWVAERNGAFTIADALSALPGAKPVADQTKADQTRMAKALHKLGCVKSRHRAPGGVRQVLWERGAAGHTPGVAAA